MTSLWLVAFALMPFSHNEPVNLLGKDDFAPEGGKFSIRFPSKPKETSQKTKSAIGEVTVFTSTFSTSDGNALMVSYSDLPQAATKKENLDSLIEGIREGARGKDGSIGESEKFKFGPEELFGYKLDLTKGDQKVKMWVVIRENRLYQIAAIGSSSFVGKEGKAFLESFQLTK